MPAIPNSIEQLTETQWDEFIDPSAWKHSRKGNRYRHWEEQLVTIFTRNDEAYGWCIAGDETRFSPRGYETEEEAIESAGFALGVGEC